MKNVLILVPCYNCELQAPRVAKNIDHLLTHLEKSSIAHSFTIPQVLFLDNQSSDKTIETLQSCLKSLVHSQKFIIAQNKENYGLGGSHKTAFLHAQKNKFDYVAVVHGDNQADAQELEDLLQTSAKNDYCSVLGTRFSHKSQLVNYSKVRTIGNRALNILYSLLLGKKITDLGSGLNLFSMSNFSNNTFMLFDDQFTFNMDLLIYLCSLKKNIVFYPIHWKTEDEKSNAVPLKVGLASLKKVMCWRLQGSKLWQKSSSKTYAFNVITHG